MKKGKIRWLYVGMLSILILSLSLTASVLTAQQKTPVVPFKIGIVTSVSGPGFGFGKRAIFGVQYRIEEEINKAGGINGYPIQLIIYDTTTKADQAAMLVERAAMVDKVFAILGPNSSSDVAAGFPTANRLGVPDIAMGGMLRGICEQNSPWCFSTMLSDDFAMEPLALLIDRFKAKNIVIMVDAKYNYAVSQGEYAYKIAERKGVKVLHDKGKLDVETGWADFTPQVTHIKALRPDLIVPIFFPVDIAHFATALKQGGIDVKKVPCYSSTNLAPDAVVAGGEAIEGWYGGSELDIESTDPVQQTWQKKLTDYGKAITTDPGLYTISPNTSCGYDAAAFLCEALRRTKITPNTPLQEARQKIRDEFTKIRMKTYSSAELRFGEGGRYEKKRLVKPIFLVQVQKGKLIGVGQVAE